jgi:hypothetical protein
MEKIDNNLENHTGLKINFKWLFIVITLVVFFLNELVASFSFQIEANMKTMTILFNFLSLINLSIMIGFKIKRL